MGMVAGGLAATRYPHLRSVLAWDGPTTRMVDVATAQINDIELYHEVNGEGPPLLLIPGLGADVRLFSGILSALAETRRVVTFDLRGGGRSAKPDIPYSIGGMADDAAQLLGSLGIEETTVVGYSMGGRIALSLALDHSDLVGRLVLAATSARTPPSKLFGWRWFVMDVLSRIPLPGSVDPQPRFCIRAPAPGIPGVRLHRSARSDHCPHARIARPERPFGVGFVGQGTR